MQQATTVPVHGKITPDNDRIKKMTENYYLADATACQRQGNYIYEYKYTKIMLLIKI